MAIPLTYTFVEEPYRRNTAGTFYDRLLIELKGEQKIYVLRDIPVILQSPDKSKPYVARIKQMWLDGQGLQWFKAAWYFRAEDVHESDRGQLPRNLFPNELFLSSFADKNSVCSIIDVCKVHDVEEDFPKSNVSPSERIFFCRYTYTPRSKKNAFKPIKRGNFKEVSDWILDLFKEVIYLHISSTSS